MSVFERFFDSRKSPSLVPADPTEREKHFAQAALQDFLELKDPACLVRGVTLRDSLQKRDVCITSLAQLKPRHLYQSKNGHPVLRLSLNQVLFGGRTTIDFDPTQLGYSMSVGEMLSIAQQSENDFAGADKSALSTLNKLGTAASSFFRTHLQCELFTAKANGLADVLPTNIQSSVAVGAIQSPLFGLDVSAECVASSKAALDALDAPADARIAVSMYLALQEKAQEFAVGQLAGSVKQIIELGASFAGNKGPSAFRGLKGKIEKEADGSKFYRFTCFFASDVSLDEFRLFESILLTLQLGSTDIDSAPSASFKLPEFSNLAASIGLDARCINPILLSYLARLWQPPHPHESFIDLFLPTYFDDQLATQIAADQSAAEKAAAEKAATEKVAAEKAAALLKSAAAATAFVGTEQEKPAATPSSSSSFLSWFTSDKEKERAARKQREMEAAAAATAEALALMTDNLNVTSPSAVSVPPPPPPPTPPPPPPHLSSESVIDLVGVAIPLHAASPKQQALSSPSVVPPITPRPVVVAPEIVTRTRHIPPPPPVSQALRSLLVAASLSDVLQAHLRFKDCDSLVQKLSTSSQLSAWQQQVSSSRSAYQGVRELISGALPSVGENLCESIASSCSIVPSAELLEKALTQYDKLLTQCRKLMRGVSGLHFQCDVLSIKARLRHSAVDQTAKAPAIACVDIFNCLPTAAEIRAAQVAQAKALEAERAREAEAAAQRAALANGPRYSAADFDTLLAQISEPTVAGTEAAPGRWICSHRDDRSEVWSRPDDSDSTAPDLIRVSASLEGVDAATAFALFHNMDERASWDTYTQETRVLQQFDPRCQVSYVMYYTNFGISPREFVEYRQTSPIPDGVAMIAKSCYHPNAPTRHDRTRGQTLYSGYVFRDIIDSSGAKRCHMVGLVQQSYGKGLPQRLVSSLNSKVVCGWVQHFVKVLQSRVSPDTASPLPPPAL